MACGHSVNVLANSYRLPCITLPVVTIGEEDMYKGEETVDNYADYYSVMMRSITNEGLGLKVGVSVAGSGLENG